MKPSGKYLAYGKINIDDLKFSKKGQELIKMYEIMAQKGYDRVDQQRVKVAFSDFELRPYRAEILPIFNAHGISSILDYSCGGSDWRVSGFDGESGNSAVGHFKLQSAYQCEPARN
jgi:hypothetical protein